MNLILRQILAVFLVCLTVTVGGASAAPSARSVPKVEWRIEVKLDANENPHSTVDLVINGKQVIRLVTPENVTSFQVMSPDDYEDYRVPAGALCACYSWWAGGGTRFYVVANPKGEVEVHRLEVEEGMTSTPRWRRIRTIKVEKS